MKLNDLKDGDVIYNSDWIELQKEMDGRFSIWQFMDYENKIIHTVIRCKYKHTTSNHNPLGRLIECNEPEIKFKVKMLNKIILLL